MANKGAKAKASAGVKQVAAAKRDAKAKKRRSFCDEYREQMVCVLSALRKEEKQLDVFKQLPSPSSAVLSKQAFLVKKIVSHRKALAFLFFEYLLEDEYD